jgi:hypothetical protein
LNPIPHYSVAAGVQPLYAAAVGSFAKHTLYEHNGEFTLKLPPGVASKFEEMEAAALLIIKTQLEAEDVMRSPEERGRTQEILGLMKDHNAKFFSRVYGECHCATGGSEGAPKACPSSILTIWVTFP